MLKKIPPYKRISLTCVKDEHLPPLPRAEFMKGYCFVRTNQTRAHGVTVTGRHTKTQSRMKRVSIARFLDIYRRLTLRVWDGFSIELYEKKPRDFGFAAAWFESWATGISG